jgi:hypothetical protein
MHGLNFGGIRDDTKRARLAFLVAGSLRYGTPFEMVSMPVRATAPEENARSSSTRPIAAVVSARRLGALSGGV